MRVGKSGQVDYKVAQYHLNSRDNGVLFAINKHPLQRISSHCHAQSKMRNLTHLHASSGGRIDGWDVHGVCSSTRGGVPNVSGGSWAGFFPPSFEFGGRKRDKSSSFVTSRLFNEEMGLERGEAVDESSVIPWPWPTEDEATGRRSGEASR